MGMAPSMSRPTLPGTMEYTFTTLVKEKAYLISSEF
jgi:hypothetical protein